MICYAKYVLTGKYYKVTLESWDSAKVDMSEPHDEIPFGAANGGLFEIKDNLVHFLDSEKFVSADWGKKIKLKEIKK